MRKISKNLQKDNKNNAFFLKEKTPRNNKPLVLKSCMLQMYSEMNETCIRIRKQIKICELLFNKSELLQLKESVVRKSPEQVLHDIKKHCNKFIFNNFP